MAGIVLSIEVDDKGSVKVKQFSDETKKAFKEMKEGPQQAKGSLDALKDSWIGLTAKIGIATAAIYAAKKLLYDFPASIASATNEIERQAGILGISTDEFQKWQYAAKMSGVNAQEFGIGLKMLSRNMEDAATGSEETSKYFSAMGISVKDSAGNLLPLNQVMMEIANRFSTWQDGPRKIAIALQLFGRGGEALIPILNQGRSGIEAYWKEAEKLGFILNQNVIKAGSEAEDIFKKISMQWQSFKLSLAPTALELAKFLEQIQPGAETIKTIFEEINRTIRDVKRAFEGLGIISPEIEVKRKILDIKGPQIGPPIIDKKEIDIVKEVQAAIEGVQYAEEQRGIVFLAQRELIEGGWIKEKGLVEQVEDELKALERATNEWGEITVGRQELVEAGWAKIAKAEEEEITEGIENARLLHQAWLEEYTKTNEIGETLARNMASAWNFNIKNIITDSENMGDAVRNVFYGMADAFTSAISKMISDWMLFGSITGKYESGKGLIGMIGGGLGSLFGGGGAAAGVTETIPAISAESILFGQHGLDFWANKPMIIGVGEGGERERVTVTPESKMGGAYRNTPVQVNIYNNNGSQVSQKSRETSQGIEIDVLIDQAVAKKISTFGSQSNKALRHNFGAKERLVSR